jgi:hypothetical protein
VKENIPRAILVTPDELPADVRLRYEQLFAVFSKPPFRACTCCGNPFYDKRRDRRYCSSCSHNGARAKRRAVQHGRNPATRLPAMVLTFEGEIIADPSEDPWRDDPWLRQCANPECRKPFSADRLDQQYCSRDCANNAVRAKRRAEHHIDFIGIDGEGISDKNENGIVVKHWYVTLRANGIDTEPLLLHRDGARLTTEEILDWLYYEVFAKWPDACFVAYGMEYDLAQWLIDLPKSRAEKLFTKKGIAARKRRDGKNPTPFPVYWRPDRNSTREWQIDTLGDKRVKLRPHEGRWRDFRQAARAGQGQTQKPAVDVHQRYFLILSILFPKGDRSRSTAKSQN